MKYAVQGDMIQDISLTNGHLIYKGIISAIKIQRQAIKFVRGFQKFLHYIINFTQGTKLYVNYMYYIICNYMYMQTKILIVSTICYLMLTIIILVNMFKILSIIY